MSQSAKPTTIRLFLAEGRADGLRLIENSNWTGLGLVCSRSDYSHLRQREELVRPGVYLLVGPPGDESLRSMLYVGEVDDVRNRLDWHLANTEFWTSVIARRPRLAGLCRAGVVAPLCRETAHDTPRIAGPRPEPVPAGRPAGFAGRSRYMATIRRTIRITRTIRIRRISG